MGPLLLGPLGGPFSEVLLYLIIIAFALTLVCFVVYHQTAGARISNSVSGGQCYLIHLIILRRFSLPGLAYIYVHKGGLKPDSFHFPRVAWRYRGTNSALVYADGIATHHTRDPPPPAVPAFLT